jgi:cell division septum initiation protein DivIVA
LTDRELKKLKRSELLEMLLDVTEENETLRRKNQELNEKLEDRRIRLDRAGSLAQASMELSRIFEDADRTASLYIENVKAQADEYLAGIKSGGSVTNGFSETIEKQTEGTANGTAAETDL